MGWRPLYGTLRPTGGAPEVGQRPMRPCPRCGVEREVNMYRPPGICRDCADTLTEEERRYWRTNARQVEA
jgi:hypothetical protein